ncbi:hypothetical protein [Hoeflea sp. TYP-13]|uniref:hypothetical protein n=1 Tax=Hoeflea sp. TYP-13 TaxID=3230023 RepID=UPI0034C5EF9C
MMMSDLRRDYFVTRLVDLAEGAGANIEALFAETEAQARAQFEEEGIDPSRVSFLRFGKFRYQNQEHTTEVLLPEGEVSDAKLAEIEALFHETYEREYTYRLDAPVEMVGIHLVASAEVGKLTMAEQPLGDADASPAEKGRRVVDFALEGEHESVIFDGPSLKPGMEFAGPAIVEDPGTTIVINPRSSARVDAYGNVHIELGE